MKLLINGYTWQDTYAQCIIQNLLISQPDDSDPIDCSMHKTQSLSNNDKLDDDSLDSLISDQPNTDYKTLYSLSSLPLYNYPRSDKRDEIVHIHKYFDKPAIPSRRAYGSPKTELVDNYAEGMYPEVTDTQIAESALDPQNLLMSDEDPAPSSVLEEDGITAMKRKESSDATSMNAEEIRQYLDNLEKLLDTNYSLDKPEDNTETENEASDDRLPQYGYAVPSIGNQLQGYEPDVDRLPAIRYDSTKDDDDDSLPLPTQLQDKLTGETSEELIDSLQEETPGKTLFYLIFSTSLHS